MSPNTLNSKLESTVVNRSGDYGPHILDALNGVVITQVDHADPNDPENAEVMRTLKKFSDTCLACAYYHKLLGFVSRVGTSDLQYAVIRLIELHDLECWGAPDDEND